MKNIGNIKSYKMKLTTTTPLYIGGGEDCSLSNLQYFYDIDSQTINIIDETKFSNFLIKNNYMDNFMKFISENQNPKMHIWFKNNNLRSKDLNIYKKTQRVGRIDMRREGINDIRLFITNSNGKAYIPGSTLKGAIRTAVLSSFILKNKTHFQEKYWERIKSSINIINKKKVETELKNICYEIEKEVFSMNKFKTSEIDSIFRGLQISDSSEIDTSKLSIKRKEDYSPNKSQTSKIPLWREYLDSYTDITFTITIDETVFPYSIQDIENMLKENSAFYNKLIENKYNPNKFELYLPDEDDTYEANINIGGGSGFINKTIIYELAPNMNEARKVIAQFLDIFFTARNKKTGEKEPAHNHIKEDTIISPRALKLVKENEEYICVGWGYLRKV